MHQRFGVSSPVKIGHGRFDGELRNYKFRIELLLNRCKSKWLDRVIRSSVSHSDHSTLHCALYSSFDTPISACVRYCALHNFKLLVSDLCSKLVSLYLLVTLLSYSNTHQPTPFHPYLHHVALILLLLLHLMRISSCGLIWAIWNCFQTRNPLPGHYNMITITASSLSSPFTGMQGGPNQGWNSLAQHGGSISNNTVSWLWSTTSENSAYIYPQHATLIQIWLTLQQH
jgi:hypothetical protein